VHEVLVFLRCWQTQNWVMRVMMQVKQVVRATKQALRARQGLGRSAAVF
jgi:hypothetical protein